jgi:PEP-CTERM motif
MKKIALTSVCALALAGVAFGQGNLAWNVISPAAMTTVTNATTVSVFFGGGSSGIVGAGSGSTAVAANGFYYELLYTGSYNGITNGVAPTTLSGLATWTDSGLEATNSVSSAGKLAPIAGNAGAQVSGMNPGTGPGTGTTNYIMLVGWSANLGTTWGGANGALAHLQSSSYIAGLGTEAFFGVSNIGFIAPATTSTSPGATVFGTAATPYGTPINSLNTTLYLVGATPEPGTMALAALGGASLLLFRRRK